MKALIVAVTLGMLASILSIAPPVAAQEAQRILKVLKGQPLTDTKALGSEVSSASTYSAQREGGTGFVTNCRARCTNGAQLQWQCPSDPNAIAVHCLPHCSPPPAHGMCFYE